MPFLQSSGAISINDIKNLFGGPASPALSNFYRGGSYIPSTKTVTTRNPASGEYYNRGSYGYQLAQGWTDQAWSPGQQILQNGNYNTLWSASGRFTSYSFGGATYFRGTYQASNYYNDPYGTSYSIYFYGYYYETYSSTNINTGVPSSGVISLSQFYGAEKP